MKSFLTDNVLKILIVFFSTIIFAIYLVWTKIEDTAPALTALNKGIKTIAGDTLKINSKNLLAVVIFSPMDCWKCLREIDVLNQLYSDFSGKLSIIGVVRSPNIIILKRFVTNRAIKFPVVFDSTGSLSQKFFGNLNYPHKLFFKYGELIRYEMLGVSKDSESENELILWIKSHI